ncbi:Chemotaxis protein PomA [compost metagenome]
MVSSSEKDLKTGISLAKKAFFNEKSDVKRSIEDVVECARIAKKETLLAVEPRLIRIRDPFLKKILRNVVDGTDPAAIRDIFETEIESEEEELLGGAKIWTDAGGYAPTIGIIGAVLGLIHVMGNLTDTSKLGGGIAVAFVATVYGVSSANLLFLPMGTKLKKRVLAYSREKQMILEGALMIAAGAQPFVLEQKMQAFVTDSETKSA